MRYCDLVHTDVDDALVKRLGFSKFLKEGKEVSVTSTHTQSGKCIVKNAKENILGKAVHHNSVIGIMPTDNKLSKKLIEDAAQNNKTIFLLVTDVTTTEHRARTANIFKMRKIVASAKKAEAKIAMITCANSNDDMLSSMQMLQIAELIGLGDAKTALSWWNQ